MLKNFAKVALRNLQRQKGYTLINVAGLALGMACFLFIMLWVQDERSYDRFHAQGNRIYRIAGSVTTASERFTQAVTSPPFAAHLIADFPEIVDAVRLSTESGLVEFEDQRYFEENLLMADPSFFTVFSFGLTRGNPESALAEPNTVVLTESASRKYFGDEDPMGLTMRLDDEIVLTVTGIMPDPPSNSHFTFDLIFSFSTWTSRNPEGAAEWFWNNFYTYVLLGEHTDVEALNAKLTRFGQRHFGEAQAEYEMQYTFWMQPLTDIYLHSDVRYEIGPTGSVAYLYVFTTVALFILLIACINFINLTTARSVRRAREVGVKKTLGATRAQLAGQFLAEAMILALLALGTALVLIGALMPAFRDLTGKDLAVTLDGYRVLFLIGLALLVGLLAGGYPAIAISGFKPVAVLKGRFSASRQGVRLREGLVVLQFSIAILLIVGIGVVRDQLRYIQHRDLGFNRDAVLVVDFGGLDEVVTAYPALQADLAGLSEVKEVAASNALIVGGLGNSGALTVDGAGESVRTSIYRLLTDYDFASVYEMNLLAGRFFSRDFPTDSTKAFIVNEAAVHNFGWGSPKDALGKPFRMFGREGEVVGVVRDFNFSSLHERIEPLVIGFVGGSFSTLSIRITSDDLPTTIDRLGKVWSRHIDGVPFTFSFLDDEIGQQYRTEQRLGSVFGVFSVLAVLIACLGLLGLATYAAEQRIKEIGVRKVLGASTPSLVTLLSRDFLKLILIAFAMAAPLGYFVMRRWLEDFAYHTDPRLSIFATAGLLVLVIALLTVSYQSVKTALTDPVRALRHE